LLVSEQPFEAKQPRLGRSGGIHPREDLRAVDGRHILGHHRARGSTAPGEQEEKIGCANASVNENALRHQ